MYSLSIAESKQLMLKFIDEYSIGGEVIAEDDNLDYLRRHNAFADVVQSSLSQLFPLARCYEIQQRSLGGLLVAGGFGLMEKTPGEDFVLQADKAGSFSCSLSGPLTLLLEEEGPGGWQVLKELTHSGESFGLYTGNLGGNDDRAKRLRICGLFPGIIKNAALYLPAFASDAAVPECAPWRRWPMPEDFMRLDQVVVERGEGYASEALYRWENSRTLVLPYDLTATVRVHYWAHAPKIEESTPDEYQYPLPPQVARLIPLKVAALVIPTERADLSLRLLQLYEQELSRLRDRQTPDFRYIESVYSM